jgi:MFS family permease
MLRKLTRLFCFVFAQRNDNSSSRMNPTTRKNVNVFLLGLAFMLMFTAFQTMGNIETTILNSARDPNSSGYVPRFHGTGYTSLAILYGVFSASNWLAPSVVTVLGPRLTMAVGGITYASFIAQLYQPNDYALYLLSALLGVGAAIIWTAQGNYLTLNSDDATMSRNSGIFWAMLQLSMVIGNTFVFFQFQGKTDIDKHTRSVVVIVLLAICCVGIITLALLRSPPPRLEDEEGLGMATLTKLPILFFTPSYQSHDLS